MRRIRDNMENESMDNARKAYDNYSDQKHSREYVMAFDADLEHNLEKIVQQIKDESWLPKGYTEKEIFERKKTPVGQGSHRRPCTGERNDTAIRESHL